MAKLYFRYGAMSSAKTLNLLATAHSYEAQGKRVLVMKPQMDKRFGAEVVQSRAGLERKADLLLTNETVFEAEQLQGVHCVLVDEAQFVHPSVIERLRDVATYQGVPVICFGLRTDFRSRLFPGSKRLMELADCIEEVKTTCHFCNRKATMNLKTVDGHATLDGPTVCLGAEEMYACVCYEHFIDKVTTASGKPVDFVTAWAVGDAADAQQAKAATEETRGQDHKQEPPQRRSRSRSWRCPRNSTEPEQELSPEKCH